MIRAGIFPVPARRLPDSLFMPDLSRRRLLTWGSSALLGGLTGCEAISRLPLLRSPVYDTTAVDEASGAAQPIEPPAIAARTALPPLFETIERRTFDFFWQTANPLNGMVPDRYPSPSPCSIAAVGFALTAYVIGADRGFVTREQARERVLTTVRFFRNAPQGPQPTGVTGHRGFFYHFLDMEAGARFATVELSTIDTALLLAGALTCREYFDRAEPLDVEVRALRGRARGRRTRGGGARGGRAAHPRRRRVPRHPRAPHLRLVLGDDEPA